MGRPKVAFVFFVCLRVRRGGVGRAQTVTGTLSNVTRAESWSYFQPIVPPESDAPIGNPDYTFFADRAELGVTR